MYTIHVNQIDRFFSSGQQQQWYKTTSKNLYNKISWHGKLYSSSPVRGVYLQILFSINRELRQIVSSTQTPPALCLNVNSRPIA